MERGEQSIAITVLVVISIVGIMATATLFLRQPSGLLTQYQEVYPTYTNVPAVLCASKVYFLGYEANYRVYCCQEDMIGQNECRIPQKVLII